jgi:hypothetical protein
MIFSYIWTTIYAFLSPYWNVDDCWSFIVIFWVGGGHKSRNIPQCGIHPRWLQPGCRKKSLFSIRNGLHMGALAGRKKFFATHGSIPPSYFLELGPLTDDNFSYFKQ